MRRLVTISLLIVAGILHAQLPSQWVLQMAQHEAAAHEHRQMFTYLQYEKSDRTGGHLWTERAVETPDGKITFLHEEDGKRIGPEREKQERGRLEQILEHPEEFAKKEEARRKDEMHATQMIQFLPKAFLFEGGERINGYVRINYRPNPDYKPQSIEERVLHAMSGYILIDPTTERLHYLEGAMKQPVQIGFGLLGTVHEGSRFKTTRDAMSVGGWKTTFVETRIDGKIFLFKTLSRNQVNERKQIEPVPNMSLKEAIALAEVK